MFMGARYFTYGFDLVGPTHSVVYHLWKREYRKTYWEHDVLAERDKSIRKIKDIMTGKLKEDKFGMGKVRSFADYCKYLGVDFEKGTFTRKPSPDMWVLPKDFMELKDEFCVQGRC